MERDDQKMEKVAQVTVLRPGQPDEVRLLKDVPAEGDVMPLDDGDAWIVVAVDTDGLSYSVFCEPLEENDGDDVP